VNAYLFHLFAHIADIWLGFSRTMANKGNSIANGQYMLVNAKEYQQIGGHAAIRHALLDDLR